MFNTKLSRNFVAISLLALLTGCATPSFSPQTEKAILPPLNLDEMYVRGIFNWWEAEPTYLLTASNDDYYSIVVDLIADGQPYDFRLADEYWTPHKSCGATQVMEVVNSVPLELYCAGDSKNLQFIPKVTGSYQFKVEQTDSSLTLVITKQ